MANYDAQINILVAGQRSIQNLANQLNAIEDTIGQIERRWRNATGALQRANIRLGVTGAQQPRGEGGRFVRDPDRQARFAAYADQRRARVEQQMSRLALGRTRAEAVRARNQINDGRELVRQTERRITVESRLNAAIEQFERRRQTFARGGGGASLPQNLQRQIQSISAAYDAAGGSATRNIRLVRALSNELVKLIETQNEYNRSASLRSKGFEAGRRLQERISEATSRAELPRQRVTNARTLATEAIAASRRGDQQAYSEAVRRATAAVSRLERESKELARAMNEQESEISRIAKLAPRSPVAGGINFPGSPKYIENQIKQNEKASKNAVSLEKQRTTALESVLEIERKIQQTRKPTQDSPISFKRITPKEAREYYASTGLQQLALPFGSQFAPAVRGGARRGAAKDIEILGGARTEAQALGARIGAELESKATQAKFGKAGKVVAEKFDKAFKETLLLGEFNTFDVFNKSIKRFNSLIVKIKAPKERIFGVLGKDFVPISGELPSTVSSVGQKVRNLVPGSPAARLEEAKANRESTQAAVALAKQKLNAVEQEAEELRKGTQAATALGKQKLRALEQEAERLRQETRSAVSLAQQKMREEEKAIADAWKMRGGPALPPGFSEAAQIQQRGGVYKTGEFSPIGGKKRLENIKASGAILEQGLINLQGKGVDTTKELEKLQKALNSAKQDGFDISLKTLDALDDQLSSARNFIQLQNKILAGQGKQQKVKEPGTGLTAALEKLREARAARVSFLGEGVSPAEAIDKIVREFGTKKDIGAGAGTNVANTLASEIAAGTSKATAAGKGLGDAAEKGLNQGLEIKSPSGVAIRAAQNVINTLVNIFKQGKALVQSALQSLFSGFKLKNTEIRTEFEQTLDMFREEMASLTTKPRYFKRLLSGIPDTGLTVDMAGSATDVFNQIKLPDILEGQIKEAYIKEFGQLPSFFKDLVRQIKSILDTLKAPIRAIYTARQPVAALQQRPYGLLPAAQTQVKPYGLLPQATIETVGDKFEARIRQAHERSAERGARVLAEDAATGLERAYEAAAAVGGRFLPPSPPVPPGGGGGAGGAGDFNRRLAEAVQQGPQALLGLEELRQPARASINELNALSAVLTELRSVLDPTAAGFDRLDDQLRETLANIDRQLERRDPNADPLTRRFGPRTGRAISEGLIGGAFPLLFGQGAGASLGGLLGGGLGGFAGGGLGFGLSLVGTALGTALDQLGAAAAEAGKALRDPIAGFEKLKEANLLASKAQEFYIQKLIESGRVTQASAVIQSEIIKKIGVTGVNDLNKLGESSSKLSKVWAEFNLQLQAAVAGPLAKLLDWITEILALSNAASASEQRAKDVSSGLTGDVRRRFDDELSRIAISQATYGKFGSLFGAISPAEANRQRNALSDLYEPFSQPPTPRKTAIDPVQQEAAIKAAQQAADEIKQAYRTAFSLQRQAADIERQAADNRRRVEEDIFRKRQEAARLENDNARTAAQIRIESADLAIRKGFAGAEGEARTVLDAVREAIKARATAEADIEQKRRELEINLADLQRESSNYIYEQAMSRMQLERSIEDYKMQVADFQLENQRKIQSLQATEQLGIASGSTLTGISGISQAIERINAAWQFRGTTQQQYKQQGDYQSSLSENFFFDFRPDLIQSAKTRLQSLSQKDIAALAFTVITEAGPTDIGKLDVAANLVTRSAGMGNIPIGQVAKQQNQYAGVAGYTRQQLESQAEGRRLFGREYDRVIRLLGAQNPATQLSPIFDRERTAAQAGNIREGSRVGYAQPTYQYQQAESTVRPISPSLSPNTEGYLQAQSQIEKITRERLQLEKQLSDLGLQGITYGIREAAQGESNILATENQLQLETKRLDLIKSSGLLSQNQLAIESKRLENSAQIQLLKSYETQALEYVNKLATEGVMMNGKLVKITKQEADLYTNEIRTGFEKRIENARIQLNIEAEILQYQQQQAIAERQSAIEREIALSGIGLKFGYIGEAARAFKESLDLGATIQQAQEYADAVQRLQDLPGRKVSEAYDESAVALQRLVDSENQAIFAAQTISDAFSGAFREIIAGTATAQEVLSGFFQNLANSFADMAAQIIAEMIKMYILQQLLNVFGAAAGGAGGGGGGALEILPGGAPTIGGFLAAADGAMFANGIKPFAMGGVVNSPTLFKFANGGAMNTGVMGEAGPEAILPLSRGSDGKLGVSASGSGGDVNVTVNVDAKGTSVQGNDQSGNQLGRAISAAVQQEIIKQRRPGGLLNK